MKAMIFAAGLGTRLGPLTAHKPKALIEIEGKSMLEHTVRRLAAAGVSEMMVNLHHHADMMVEQVEYLRGIGYNITISDERDQLLDTAGGLYRVREFFAESPFIGYNVDEFTDLDLEGMYRQHNETGALATLAVRHRPGNRMLLVDEKGRLRGWRNNQTKEEIVTGGGRKNLDEVGFSGIQVISPEIFSLMEEGIYSLTSLYLMLAGKHLIMTCLHDYGYWFDAGTPQSLEKITAHMQRGR